MDEIKLIKPTMEYEDDIWQLRQEILESRDKDKFAGCGNLEECSCAKEWIETISALIFSKTKKGRYEICWFAYESTRRQT